jgi:hypothetical protein
MSYRRMRGTGWIRTTVSWFSARRLCCLSYGPLRLSATIWRLWVPYSDAHNRQNLVGEMERDVGTAPTPAGWKPAVHL